MLWKLTLASSRENLSSVLNCVQICQIRWVCTIVSILQWMVINVQHFLFYCFKQIVDNKLDTVRKIVGIFPKNIVTGKVFQDLSAVWYRRVNCCRWTLFGPDGDSKVSIPTLLRFICGSGDFVRDGPIEEEVWYNAKFLFTLTGWGL